MSDEREVGGLAIDDPIRVIRARQLLASAAKAVDQFEDAIRELVTMRAWVLLGYKDLAMMWEAENGFKCPTYAKALAVEVYEEEGMLSPGGDVRRQGHRSADVAKAVGLPFHTNSKGNESSTQVTSMRSQLAAGVPAKHVVSTGGNPARKAIDSYGTRARSHVRRSGVGPDEMVSESFHLVRREADAISEIARKANVPKAEIYRQAVTQYLERARSVEQREIDRLRANIEEKGR
ncbi:MAG: hypothetical protein JWQ81_8566 [Amycolatopsis sp.]|uniref:hypothetical protein n=1 Tax=Amycolatopsis sp. TaxID=37632 RepID=UPI00262D14DD|nr:hypothetical protein [Amycolatopsis sp.]MCU1687827.1 hypothetical protein [Amycolatopsis sp.]